MVSSNTQPMFRLPSLRKSPLDFSSLCFLYILKICLTLCGFELYRNKWYHTVFLLSSVNTVCEIHSSWYVWLLFIFTAELNYHLGISLVIHFPHDEHLGGFPFISQLQTRHYELLCISTGAHQVSVRYKTACRIIRSEYPSLPLLDNAKIFSDAFVPIYTPGV